MNIAGYCCCEYLCKLLSDVFINIVLFLQERGCYLLVLVKTDPKGRKYYEPLIQNLGK